MKINNFSDLKVFLNTLNDDFLKQPVHIVINGDDNGIHRMLFTVELSEDLYLQENENFLPANMFSEIELLQRPLISRTKRPAGTPLFIGEEYYLESQKQ